MAEINFHDEDDDDDENDNNSIAKFRKQLYDNWIVEELSLSPLTMDCIIDLCEELEDNRAIHKTHREEIVHLSRTSARKAMDELFETILYHDSFYDLFKAIDTIENDCLNKLKERLIRNDPSIIQINQNQQKHFYKVRSCPYRGNVLILNNSFSKNKNKTRSGCDKDVSRLIEVFDKFHYHVTTNEDDLTHEAFNTQINEFSNNECHDSCDAAGLVIMSHGENEVILDCDNKPMEITDLLAPLKKPGSKLCNKPLFVIIQACRGNEDLSKYFKENIFDQLRIAEHDADSDDKKEAGRDRNMKKDSSGNKLFLPDTIVLYSTLPKFFSDRLPEKGSAFIQSLCKVVDKYGWNHSWQELCTLICAHELNIQVEWATTVQINMKPQFVMNLTAAFYLDSLFLQRQ